MPQHIRTEAMVLRSRDVGEADREVTLLTRTDGKVLARVRGARRSGSRLGGALSLFSAADVLLYRGRNRHTVTGAMAGSPLASFTTDPVRFAAAALWAEAATETLPEGEVVAGAYPLVLGGFGLLGQAAVPAVSVGFLFVKLSMLLGYAPVLDRCANCSKQLAPPLGFGAASGGALCRSCAHQGRPLTMAALELLAQFASGREDAISGAAVSAAVAREVRAVMVAHLVFRLERPLKSAQVLEDLIGHP